MSWLAGKPQMVQIGVQTADYTSDRLAFAPPHGSGSQVLTDIYPTLIQKDMGHPGVLHGPNRAGGGDFYDGDLVTYAYPVGLLQTTKNLVYNDGGAEIYK